MREDRMGGVWAGGYFALVNHAKLDKTYVTNSQGLSVLDRWLISPQPSASAMKSTANRFNAPK